MPSEQIIFAGVELSSGRKPVTFAGLDEDLNIKVLETWNSAEVLSCLQDYERSTLAVNVPSSKGGQELYMSLTSQLAQAGLRAGAKKSHSKPWIETNAQDCFRALGGHDLLPHRSLEGRLQRCAILYEQGLPLKDPVDMLEEITRYKLVQGILPLESLPSSKELDALVTAYLAWMSFSRPGQIVQKDERVLPAPE
jgi:hypothetical protein